MFTKNFTLGWLLALAILLLLIASCFAGQRDSDLLRAINQIEASGKHFNVPVGDNGKAIGPFQIHKNYWLDSGVQGSYAQCTNYDYACKVVIAYWHRYEPRAYANKDFETLARLHNGGPNWRNLPATKKYWYKVRKVLT